MADKSNERRNGPSSAQDHEEEASEEIKKYLQILNKEPSSLVFAALAEAYRKNNLVQLAIDACKTGLRHHPDFASGRVALARAYHDAGQIDKAQSELEKVVASVPDNLIAQKLLAKIYREKNDLDNLEKTTHRILSFDPQDEASAETLRWIEEHRRSDSVTSTESQADAPQIITKTIAEIYASQGYYEKACDIYQRLCRKDPGNADYHGRLADLKEKVCRQHRSKERGGSSTSLPEVAEKR